MRKWDNQKNRMSYRFRYVGLGMVVLVILFSGAMFTEIIKIEPERKELIKNIVFGFLLFGLFFIAFAPDKVEDERSMYLKMKTSTMGFGMAIFYTIFKPFVNYFFGDPMEVSGQEVALVMLLGLIFTSYLQKFAGKE